MYLALKEPDRALADFSYLLNWYETDPKTVRPVPRPIAKDVDDRKDPNAFAVLIGQDTKNEAPGEKEMEQSIVASYAYLRTLQRI